MAQNEPARFLLLLPPLSSHAALKPEYGDTLTQVLKEVAAHTADAKTGVILELALACPHLVGKHHTPRSSLYAETQSLVAGVYKLICIIAAREGINVEDAAGVDVRVLLIAWKVDMDEAALMQLKRRFVGLGVGLQTLASSGRPWQFAFGVESEAGEAMVKAFVAAKGNGEEITRVQSEPSEQGERQADATSQDDSLKQMIGSGEKHFHVAVGGTFDHIHIGHKLLLTMTVFALDEDDSNGERSITFGITGDQLLVNKKHAEYLEDWAERQQSTARFVDAIVDFAPPTTPNRQETLRNEPGPNGKSVDVTYQGGLVLRYPEIQDPFGPTITEERISALVLSAETRAGGKAINDKRGEKGFATLQVFEVDVLDAEEAATNEPTKTSFESKLSSTATRERLARKTQSSL